MFAITENFAKVTGLIAGVAGCVVVGFQIANDFKTNAPVAQKALDICQVCYGTNFKLFVPFSMLCMFHFDVKIIRLFLEFQCSYAWTIRDNSVKTDVLYNITS